MLDFGEKGKKTLRNILSKYDIFFLNFKIYNFKKNYRLPPAQSYDKENRPSKYHSKFSAWKRKKFLASPASVKKKIDHISGKNTIGSVALL